MNLPAIRIKCAEIVGWTKETTGGFTAWLCPYSIPRKRTFLPNYHSSLDAIVPVVRAMPTVKRTAALCVLCANTADTEEAMTATPAQWCEAYLREAGLWK